MNSDKLLNGLRIMLVEDDMLIALDLEDMLTDMGASVAGPYGRLAEALEAAESIEIDGAILDLDLRGEMSFPVIDLLKERKVPVIVCSGYVELPQLQEKLSDIPTIGKPCVHTKLTALIQTTFRRAHLGANDDLPSSISCYSVENRH